MADDWADLKRKAERKGWRVEQGKKHVRWFSPHGGFVVSGSTPTGDRRAFLNHLRNLRRYGWED